MKLAHWHHVPIHGSHIDGATGQAFHLRWAEVDWSLPLDRSDGREGQSQAIDVVPLVIGRYSENLSDKAYDIIIYH